MPGPYALGRVKKLQMIIRDTDLNCVTRFKISLQNLLRERILDLLLDRPFQRPRSVYRVESGVRKFVSRRV